MQTLAVSYLPFVLLIFEQGKEWFDFSKDSSSLRLGPLRPIRPSHPNRTAQSQLTQASPRRCRQNTRHLFKNQLQHPHGIR
jgi:hypothetical protein